MCQESGGDNRTAGVQDSLLIDRTLTGSGTTKSPIDNLLLMLKLMRYVGLNNTKRKVYSIHKGMILEAY